MRVACRIMVFLFMVPFLGTAQEEEQPKSQIVELVYIKPMKGKEEMLKKAVEEHNEKYHSKAPYGAGLYAIATGNEAGWMVWAMGPFSYTELDGAPGEGEHMKNWRSTVDPFVAEYGRTEHWRFNKSLSHSDDKSQNYDVLWFMDIESNEYYRFKEFMTKAQKVMAENNKEMEVWNNEFTQGDGRDVAMIFSFDKWGERDLRDFNLKTEYEKEYGEGSWKNAMEEWDDFVKGLKIEVWRNL